MTLIKQLNELMESAVYAMEAITKMEEKESCRKKKFSITTIIISSIITVILGIKEITFGVTVALVLSGVVTIINGLDALYHPNGSINTLRKAESEFGMLMMEIKFYITKGEYKQEEIDSFRTRYLETIKILAIDVKEREKNDNSSK